MTVFYANKILKLPKNNKGRDFIVGDLHGRFDLLVLGLEALDFDENIDRVISVGDLIDRGMFSELAGDFLKFPFFYAVRGNHEDCLIELQSTSQPALDFVEYHKTKMGSDWWFKINNKLQQEVVDELRKIPMLIEIETDDGNIGVIHADIPEYLNWSEFKEFLEKGDDAAILQALWGRNRLDYAKEKEVKGIKYVFVGHTVQPKARKLANVIAIDTGAVFKNHLTIFEVGSNVDILNNKENIYADICIYTKNEGRKDFIVTESSTLIDVTD